MYQQSNQNVSVVSESQSVAYNDNRSLLMSPASSSASLSSSSSSTFNYYNPYYQTSSPYNYYSSYNYYANIADNSAYVASLTNEASHSLTSSDSSNSSLNAYWPITSSISASTNYYEPSSSSPSITTDSSFNLIDVKSSYSSSVVPYPADDEAQEDEVNGRCEMSVPNSRVQSCKLSRKHQLPDLAVDIMNEWFDEHQHNPYPQMHEKEMMAQRGGITIKQVTAWFSNRRNRSQNTKPKRMQRVIKDNFSKICQEIAYNPDRDVVAEKVRRFQETLEKRY